MKKSFLNNRYDSDGSLMEKDINDGNRIEEIEIVRIDDNLKQDPNLPNHQQIDIDAFFQRLKQEKFGKNGEKPSEENKSDNRM